MIGTRIRELRTARHLSLADVAGKALISAATLSRIETGKQSINVGLMAQLAEVLNVSPHDLLDETVQDGDLAGKIADLKPSDRTQFWKDLGSSRKRDGEHARRIHDVGMEVEELLAQIDFLRGEVERIREQLRVKKGRR